MSKLFYLCFYVKDYSRQNEVHICSPLCQVIAGIHVTSPETSKEYFLKVGLHNQITYLQSSLLGLSSLNIHFSSLLNIFFCSPCSFQTKTGILLERVFDGLFPKDRQDKTEPALALFAM